MNAIEEWRPVVGYEGDYEVSSIGRVRRLTFRNRMTVRVMPMPRIISNKPNQHGYPTACLCRENVAKTLRVHKLVAEAFIGPRPIGLVVAHLDGNRMNNHVGNLSYATNKENESHKVGHGTQPVGERNGFAKLANSDAKELRYLRQKFGDRLTFSTLAKMYDISETYARMICGGRARKVA